MRLMVMQEVLIHQIITLWGNDAIDYWEGTTNASNFWRNNNNRFGTERAVVYTGNGWITLLGEQARAYNEGRWNEID